MLWLAVVVGKLIMRTLRRLGRGGSTLPGRIALSLCPHLIGRLTGQLRRGTVVITGTNGKTTTTMLLARILREQGSRVVYNRSGANMLAGVASSLIEAASLAGQLDADWALIEADEAAAAGLVVASSPRMLVVTNCFRDQLDRYGEVEHTAALIHRAVLALSAGASAVLNADDPLVAAAGDGARASIRFFGLPVGDRTASYAPDLRHCLSCQCQLEYGAVHYAHLGVWSCPACGATRPGLDYTARDVRRAGIRGSTFDLEGPSARLMVSLPLPGLFNVYNVLAAAAAALELGVPVDVVATGVASAPAAFGRMERVMIDGRQVLIALIKNPTGCNEVLALLAEELNPRTVLVAINDQLADGTDVSWLWDAEFELLSTGGTTVIVTGLRAADMAVRLKYGGCNPDLMSVEPDLEGALDQATAVVSPGDMLYVLPTYTAMLALRAILHRRGLTTPFWEEGS